MRGLMQDHPLLISSLIRHAAEKCGRREVPLAATGKIPMAWQREQYCERLHAAARG
jgi:hypothetical protein